MAYNNSPYGRHETDATTDALSVGGQPAFRAYQPGAHSVAAYGESESTPTVPAAELSDVFDDPAAGEPGRDRLGVHWTWEALLLIGVGTLGYLVFQADRDALRGDDLSLLLVFAAGFGLLGLAAGVSLRAGAPNLAIGAVAAAAGAYFADRGNEGVATPTIFALGVAVMLGLAVAVLVVAFHVPGWAASLAAAAAAVVWLQLQDPVIPLAGDYDPTDQAAFVFAGVAAVAIVGGLIGALRPVRRALGRFRPIGDPARYRGGTAALVTAGAIVLSMVFAVIAGVLLVAGEGVPAQGSAGVHWLEWTLIGLGVALIGGTSVYGRRGGVFGTVLAMLALVLFDRYQRTQDWDIALLATAAGAVALGLVVTRLIETFGRPRGGDAVSYDDESGEQWTTATPAGVDGRQPVAETGTPTWPSAATDSWSSALPARPAPGGGPDPWDEDRWSRR
jgi:ribose/xylose/arabinose/galactoside ABC-type transport system permease subunit